MNRKFTAILFFVLGLPFFRNAVSQDFSPITVSGFNEDVVAEGGAASSILATSKEMDALFPSNYVLCTEDFAAQFDFQPGGVYGLPESGILSATGRTYRFAPWAENNAQYLFPGDSGVLSLDTPSRFTDLSLLMLATEGNSDIRLTFRFSDGTYLVRNQTIPDWFSPQATPFQGYGRVKRKDAPYATGDYEGAPNGNPKLFFFDYLLPCTKTLVAIGVRNINPAGGQSFRSFIFAVSGKEKKVIPAITITASKTRICAGDTIQFAAQFENGGSSPQIDWEVNGAIAALNRTSFVSSTLQNGDVVRCVLQSNATCAFPVQVASNTFTIEVLPKVRPGITLEASDTVICQGKRVIFDAFPDEPGTFRYTWFRNGDSLTNAGLRYVSSQLENQDRIWVRISSAAPCATPKEAFSDTLRIRVFPTQSLQFSVPDSLYPDSDPVLLSGNASLGQFRGNGVENGRFLPGKAGLGRHTLLYYVPNNPCIDSVSRVVVVRERPLPCRLEPTTFFSPNGDGKNDTWWIGDVHARCISGVKAGVYNRWGLKVFESEAYQNDWQGEFAVASLQGLGKSLTGNFEEGERLPNGPYFFVLDYTLPDGKTLRKSGVVTKMD